MSRPSRILAVGAIGLIGILFVTGASFPKQTDPRPICERAAEWIALNKDALPQTFDEMLTVPSGFRAAAFSALSPDLKSRIIREKYATFIETTALSTNQMAVVRLAADLAEPSAYVGSGKRDAVLDERLAALVLKIHAAFDDPAHRAWFYGVAPPTSLPAASWASSLKQRVQGLFVARARVDPQCGCWSGNSDLGTQEECNDSRYVWRCAQPCAGVTQDGCGPNGTKTCDGYCDSVGPGPGGD